MTPLEILAPVALGVGSGLANLLPLALLAALGRAGVVPLAAPFDGLSSTPALVAVWLAALLEFVADKHTTASRPLHRLMAPVAVAGGTIAAASHTAAGGHPAGEAMTLGLLTGGAAAGLVHTARRYLRGLLGLVPPVGRAAGYVEDLMATSLTWMVAFAPWLLPAFLVAALGMAGVALWLGWWGVRRLFGDADGRLPWPRLRGRRRHGSPTQPGDAGSASPPAAAPADDGATDLLAGLGFVLEPAAPAQSAPRPMTDAELDRILAVAGSVDASDFTQSRQ